jgi:hypothetical protein
LRNTCRSRPPSPWTWSPRRVDVDRQPGRGAAGAGGLVEEGRDLQVDAGERTVAGEIEEIVGQPPQAGHLAEDVLQRLGVALVQSPAAALDHQLHRAADDAQRIPDLVRHRRRELRHRRAPGRTGGEPALPTLRRRPASGHQRGQHRGAGGQEPAEVQRAVEVRLPGRVGLTALQHQDVVHRSGTPHREVSRRHPGLADGPSEREAGLAGQGAPDPADVDPQQVHRPIGRPRRIEQDVEVRIEQQRALEPVGLHHRAKPPRVGLEAGLLQRPRSGGARPPEALLGRPLQRARGGPVKAEGGQPRTGEAEHREQQGQQRASHQSTAPVQTTLPMKTHSVAFRSGMFESTRSSRTVPRTDH